MTCNPWERRHPCRRVAVGAEPAGKMPALPGGPATIWLQTVAAWLLLGYLASAATPAPKPEEPSSQDLVQQGNRAFRSGDRMGAVALFSRAIEANPTNLLAYYNRGRLQETEGHYAEALADYTKMLTLDTNHTTARQLRGALQLRLGHVDEAIADFNRYLQQLPKAESHHWQRGIAFYFAGHYEEGARQFTMTHAANTNDVENALWHFQCIARHEGLAKARKALLPVGEDRRIPMMTVYDLFAGKATPEEVLAAAEAGSAPDQVRAHQRFLAHYYVGFFYEAQGNFTRALEQIDQAVKLAPRVDFIGDIARVHAGLLRQRQDQHSAKP